MVPESEMIVCSRQTNIETSSPKMKLLITQKIKIQNRVVTSIGHVLKEATNENSENLSNVIFSKSRYMHDAGTFCVWLEIKMQLNK